jgi:hypothetical protein
MFYATKQYTYDCQMMSAGKLAAPESLYVALVTDTPDYDTSTFGELTEIAAGNGYTSGGKEVEPGDITVSKETAYTELELPSPLVRGRGLKLSECWLTVKWRWVAPRTGAWIETLK